MLFVMIYYSLHAAFYAPEENTAADISIAISHSWSKVSYLRFISCIVGIGFLRLIIGTTCLLKSYSAAPTFQKCWVGSKVLSKMTPLPPPLFSFYVCGKREGRSERLTMILRNMFF